MLIKMITTTIGICSIFFSKRVGNESCNLIGSQCDLDFPISDHGYGDAHNVCVEKVNNDKNHLRETEKTKYFVKLFTGLRLVRIVKPCDLWHENAALGLGPPVTPLLINTFTLCGHQSIYFRQLIPPLPHMDASTIYYCLLLHFH